MARFFRRFIGALVLDASIYEDIEADRQAGLQSILIVLAAVAAAGVAGIGLGAVSLPSFITAAILALGGWLVWAALISTIGTTFLAEPQTKSNARELLRTLGFAAAPGVFLAFAGIRPAAPLVFILVSVWMIAAAVIAVRQALDFKSVTRAIAVCVIAWVLSIGLLAALAVISTEPVM